jgi:hypothetical protein
LLAISRCFSGLIAAKPRFALPLALCVAMPFSDRFSDEVGQRVGGSAVRIPDRGYNNKAGFCRLAVASTGSAALELISYG